MDIKENGAAPRRRERPARKGLSSPVERKPSENPAETRWGRWRKGVGNSGGNGDRSGGGKDTLACRKYARKKISDFFCEKSPKWRSVDFQLLVTTETHFGRDAWGKIGEVLRVVPSGNALGTEAEIPSGETSGTEAGVAHLHYDGNEGVEFAE